MEYTKTNLIDSLLLEDVSTSNNDLFSELEKGIYSALKTYSNVHRGRGHYSMVTTHLYEKAREIVLDYLGLNKSTYTVVFCTPRRAAILKKQFVPKSYYSISSREIGLSIGVVGLAVKKTTLPKGVPFQTGGGTAKLIAKDWIIWAKGADKFEAGTPAIINVIAFARALRMLKKYGLNTFKRAFPENKIVQELLYEDDLNQYTGHKLLDELRKTLIGHNLQVPTMHGLKPFINLDNSASTPTFKPVWNVFRQTWQLSEIQQKEIVNEVKSICAKSLGAPLTEYEVLFTSNTTEAINLAAENLGLNPEAGIETVVVNTLMEHSSNDLPWRFAAGHSIIHFPVDTDGFLDLNELEKLLDSYNQKGKYGNKRIRLLAVSGASNVLGVCNNVEAISRIVHQHGANLLVDAAQLVAHRKVDMEQSGIDFLAFSAHKVYAPFGCGALIARKGLLKFSPTEMEQIHSSGEENVAGIAALGKALLLLHRIGMDVIHDEEQALTKRAIRGMTQIHGLTIYGIKHTDSSKFDHKIGVVLFNLKNIIAHTVAKELAIRGGIGVRSGCHCAHMIIKQLLNVGPSLQRFQWLIQTTFPKISLPGLTRISFGIENTEDDVDHLIRVLDEIAGNTTKTNNKTPGLSKAEVNQQMKGFVKAAELRVYS
jgi:selenocysteine lyase/cysteine desulfurase